VFLVVCEPLTTVIEVFVILIQLFLSPVLCLILFEVHLSRGIQTTPTKQAGFAVRFVGIFHQFEGNFVGKQQNTL
jgi:hypothetical protein